MPQGYRNKTDVAILLQATYSLWEKEWGIELLV